MFRQGVVCSVLVCSLQFGQGLGDGADVVWAKDFGSTSYEQATGVALDGAGNSIVVGKFGLTVDFGDSNSLTAHYGYDMYVAKYTPSGTCLWAKHSFSNTGNDEALDVAVDSDGSAYVVGWFTKNINFDGFNTFSAIDANTANAFVWKVDADGNHAWSKNFGGTLTDWATSVAVDSYNSVYVGGYFTGVVDFGGGNLNVGGSSTQKQIFLLQMSGGTGNHFWSQDYGSTSNEAALDVAIDNAGFLLTTGWVENHNVDFGGGVSTVGPTPATRSMFILRTGTSGYYSWSHTIGKSGTVEGIGVAVDAESSVYIIGNWWSASLDLTDFGGGVISRNSGNGNTEVFLLKLTSTGAFAWIKSWGDAYHDLAGAIACSLLNNHVFVTGRMQTSSPNAQLGGDGLESVGQSDVFVASYDKDGTHQFSGLYGGNLMDGGADIAGIAAGGDGSVVVVSEFKSTINFHPSTKWDSFATNPNTGATQAFVMKIVGSSATPNPTTSNPTTLNPTGNPTITPFSLASGVLESSPGNVISSVSTVSGISGPAITATLPDSSDLSALGSAVTGTFQGGFEIKLDNQGLSISQQMQVGGQPPGGGVKISLATLAEIEGLPGASGALDIEVSFRESSQSRIVSVEIKLISNGNDIDVQGLTNSFSLLIPLYSSTSDTLSCNWLDEATGVWEGSGCVFSGYSSPVVSGNPVAKCTSSHLTDFMIIARAKQGLAVDIGSFAYVLLLLYGGVGIFGAILATLLSNATGGCCRKGHRLTFFQLVACSFLACARTLDVALKQANVVSVAASAIIGGICHLILILLWCFISVSWLSVVVQVKSMRSSFKGLLVTKKKQIVILLAVCSAITILLFLLAAVAETGTQTEVWAQAGTLFTAVVSLIAALAFAISGFLLVRAVGGKVKGKSAASAARNKVVRKVLLAASLLVFSLVGSTGVLFWTSSGSMANASSSDWRTGYITYHLFTWVALPAILYLNLAVVSKAHNKNKRSATERRRSGSPARKQTNRITVQTQSSSRQTTKASKFSSKISNKVAPFPQTTKQGFGSSQLAPVSSLDTGSNLPPVDPNSIAVKGHKSAPPPEPNYLETTAANAPETSNSVLTAKWQEKDLMQEVIFGKRANSLPSLKEAEST